MNEAVLLSALGIVGTAVAALVWIIKYLFDKILPAIDALSDLVKKGNENTVANTKQLKSNHQYLRERNGRDSVMHKEMIASIKEIPKQIIATANETAHTLLEAPITQNVTKQEVETQVISKKKSSSNNSP